MISIIAAIGKNRELGKDNKLLWDIPEDMAHFRNITKGKPVIMGRKTFESIGHPLPDRKNIIITNNPSYSAPGCLVVDSLKNALDAVSKTDEPEVCIIGGASIYAQALDLADKLYLTIVDKAFDADTFFPEYAERFRIVSSEEKHDDTYAYTFLELTKIL